MDAPKKVISDDDIIKEFLKREQQNKALDEACFDKQLAFINDPARLKALLVPRRGGKSSVLGINMYKVALNVPKSTVIYLGLTRESAQKVMMKDVLIHWNNTLDLGVKWIYSPFICGVLPNGSHIYVLGLDKDKKQADKLLGQKFSLVIIDEAGSFSQDLSDIIYKVIEPATMDLEGTVCLAGTCQNNTYSFFFNVTTGKEPGWSVHKWMGYDNPHIREKLIKDIAKMEKRDPNVRNTAFFKQMYLNEWVVDDTKLVYKYNADRNLVKQLPVSKDRWIDVMGIDLGFNDATAITVISFSYSHRAAYVRYAFKASGLDVTETANAIKAVADQFNIARYVVDGASKQVVEEIKNRFQIPLELADKMEKAEFIHLMNDELIQGYIKVVEGNGTDQLIRCWSELTWAKDSNTKEDPGIPNDIADSCLYTWRACYNYYSKVDAGLSDLNKDEIEALQHKKQTAEKAKYEAKKDFWEKYDDYSGEIN